MATQNNGPIARFHNYAQATHSGRFWAAALRYPAATSCSLLPIIVAWRLALLQSKEPLELWQKPRGGGEGGGTKNGET